MKKVLGLLGVLISPALLAQKMDPEFNDYHRCEALLAQSNKGYEFVYQPERRRERITNLIATYEESNGLIVNEAVASKAVDTFAGQLHGEVVGFLKLAREVYGKDQFREIKEQFYEKYRCQRFHKPLPKD